MSSWLTLDALERLHEVERRPRPPGDWSYGCTGAARAWLVFVGPSPGGQSERRWTPRGRAAPHHDCVFWEPVNHWSRGFKRSLKPLIETIVGLPFTQSGKLYAFANFDYVSRPDARLVPLRHMKQGIPAVMEVLTKTRPRLVTALEHKSADMLCQALVDRGASLEPVAVSNPRLPVSRKSSRRYRPLEILRVVDKTLPELDKSFVVRLPQHPARIFSSESATRIGKKIHGAIGKP